MGQRPTVSGRTDVTLQLTEADAKALQRLTPTDIERLKVQADADIKRRQGEGVWSGAVRPHTAYQLRPIEWIVRYLGVPVETIRWSLSPEYQNCSCSTEVCQGGGPHRWDGDKDPLAQALIALSKGHDVAVSSGTGLGKTYLLGACAALWFLACFPNAIVATIAPKSDQLLLNMWKEMGRMFGRFKGHFPSATMLSGKLRMLEEAEEREVWAATAVVAGVDADEEVAQRLKGLHGAHMLWIVEETPGIVTPIMNTIINTATGSHNPILALGNPESQHDTLATFAARPSVKAIRVSAYDFPNIVLGRDLIPGAASIKSVNNRLDDADGDTSHPLYLSQVRGIAPKESRRALIRRQWCEEAVKRWGDQGLRNGPLGLGVDVADSPTGDQSMLARGQGAVCTEVVNLHAADAGEVGRLIHREIMNPLNPVDPRYVGIDSVGVGASTVNELKRLGVKVRRISGGMRAMPRVDTESLWSETRHDTDGAVRPAGPVVVEAETYANLRSQVLWMLREDLRLGRIGLPDDDRLIEELTAIEYEEPNGKITAEPKDKIRTKLRRSPDRADAVAYWNFVRRRTPVRVRTASTIPDVSPNRDYRLEKMLTKRQKQEEVRHKRMVAALNRRARSRRSA